MTRSSEKPLAVAGVLTFLTLCYQLQAPQWLYVGGTCVVGAGAALWITLEKRVTKWMPDSEFPRWLLTQMT